ncbi:hypothetical protein TNIN_433721 [Trichonephila inaurata madagascariensis]|uniref:Uncharacterized protein n=1 Tax=Trichonephila inaurata madagascariensis TaxID=2747483 RepID=A0A8X6XS13_9ARAC|nr:hypothetical protein TNIN_433721 [Trichonephila inaurata madagascariensis]
MPAFEAIGVKYPDSEWLHVYMDSFPFDDYLTASLGAFSSLFSFYVSERKFRTAFDGEVEVIQIALKQLLDLEDKFCFVFFSDYQASIQAIGSTKDYRMKSWDHLQKLALKKKYVVL